MPLPLVPGLSVRGVVENNFQPVSVNDFKVCRMVVTFCRMFLKLMPAILNRFSMSFSSWVPSSLVMIILDRPKPPPTTDSTVVIWMYLVWFWALPVAGKRMAKSMASAKNNFIMCLGFYNFRAKVTYFFILFTLPWRLKSSIQKKYIPGGSGLFFSSSPSQVKEPCTPQ